jgi:hypothetical protein
LLFRIESVRMNLHSLWARYTLALSADPKYRERGIREARRLASRLGREANPFARTISVLVRAGVAAREGDEATARARLEEAMRRADELDLGCYEQMARRRRGVITGGEQGDAEVASADEWMRRHGVVSPARLAEVLVPGF